MSKKKPAQTRRDPVPAPAPAAPVVEAPGGHSFLMFRETVESIVVAFVLAFLFRTFEAEAFVIPTGSMSPSLQGRHIDVECTQCGARFRTSASTEDMEDAALRGLPVNPRAAKVVAGMCPMCRYPMPFTSDLPARVRAEVAQLTNVEDIETQESYPGDRILVNKYGYDFGEPERWDVVVFKFPGDGEMNYIKRLVGLPGEELQVFQGDIFTRPLGQRQAPFKIERKPADKVAAMLQEVHDTDYEPSSLYKGGWPLRWAATTPDGWKVDAEPGERVVAQQFTIDAPAGAPLAWLRYRHQVAEQTEDWAIALSVAKTGSFAELATQEGISAEQAERDFKGSIRPQLISDFNSYNASLIRQNLDEGARWSMDSQLVRTLAWGFLGNNWVSDLAVDANVDVQEARGELVLDLVEAGYHFRATIDLKDGKATLAIVDGRTGEALPFTATAQTPITGPGEYQLRFANVDDQLLLWVDGEVVAFDNSTYDPDVLFASNGGRRGMLPWADTDVEGDQGDLAPVGIGAKGAKLAISRLAVLRDVYYTATNDHEEEFAMSMDYDYWQRPARVDGQMIPGINNGRDLFAVPETWPRFLTRRAESFDVKPGQLFVMGDNSPASADSRLWRRNGSSRGTPGGSYLDRRLVIGKAVAVFWPHSWGELPLPVERWRQKMPGFPGFGDMRLVK